MQYKVGDVVRIREWDDLAAEFGEKYGDIPCPFAFISDMREFCGNEYVISEVRSTTGIYHGEDVQKLFFESTDDIGDYAVSGQMVEPVLDESIPEDFIVPNISALF